MKRYAYYVSLLLVFTTSWENMISFEGLGTISRLTGIVLAVVWLAAVLVTGEIRRPRAFHICVGLFVLWSAASILWTVDVESTQHRITTYVQLLVLVAVLWDLYQTSARVEMAMQAYVLGCFVSIGSLIGNYWRAIEVVSNRYAATGFNPNHLAIILALSLPMAWYLAALRDNQGRSQVMRIVNFVFIPVALIGMLLAGSRGAMVAASPVVVLIAITMGRLSFWPRAALLAAGAGLAFAFPYIAPDESVGRLLTAGESIRLGDMNGRVAVWREGIGILSEHQWLGVGAGAFKTAATATNHVAHNVFMSIVVELGLPGLVLFLSIVALVAWEAVRLPRRHAFLWVTALSVWLLGAMVQNLEQRKLTWLVFSLVTVSAAARQREDRAEILEDVTLFQGPSPLPHQTRRSYSGSERGTESVGGAIGVER